MDEMLQGQKQTPDASRGAINSYYSNLSMLGYSKPFFFPPPDLGVVESMGSYENTSRFFRSVKSSNMNKSFCKNTSVVGISLKNRNSTISGPENEIPLRPQITQEDFQDHGKSEEEKGGISEASLKSVDSNFTNENSNQEQPEKHDVGIGPMGPIETLEDTETEENINDLSMESYYVLEDLTREGLQKYLKDSMLTFNEKYSIHKEEIEDNVEIIEPSFDLCYKY